MCVCVCVCWHREVYTESFVDSGVGREKRLNKLLTRLENGVRVAGVDTVGSGGAPHGGGVAAASAADTSGNGSAGGGVPNPGSGGPPAVITDDMEYDKAPLSPSPTVNIRQSRRGAGVTQLRHAVDVGRDDGGNELAELDEPAGAAVPPQRESGLQLPALRTPLSPPIRRPLSESPFGLAKHGGSSEAEAAQTPPSDRRSVRSAVSWATSEVAALALPNPKQVPLRGADNTCCGPDLRRRRSRRTAVAVVAVCALGSPVHFLAHLARTLFFFGLAVSCLSSLISHFLSHVSLHHSLSHFLRRYHTIAVSLDLFLCRPPLHSHCGQVKARRRSKTMVLVAIAFQIALDRLHSALQEHKASMAAATRHRRVLSAIAESPGRQPLPIPVGLASSSCPSADDPGRLLQVGGDCDDSTAGDVVQPFTPGSVESQGHVDRFRFEPPSEPSHYRDAAGDDIATPRRRSAATRDSAIETEYLDAALASARTAGDDREPIAGL